MMDLLACSNPWQSDRSKSSDKKSEKKGGDRSVCECVCVSARVCARTRLPTNAQFVREPYRQEKEYLIITKLLL